MAKREFLMLAHDYSPTKHGIGGWFLSEKLDGQRCFWDGGISRGILKSDIPWANTLKDERLVTPPRATGLWSRYGNVIQAPVWWLDALPLIPLDGELWMGRQNRQQLMSAVRKLTPEDWAWKGIRFYAFDMPSYEQVFAQGTINNPNFQKIFHWDDLWKWISPRLGSLNHLPTPNMPFQTIVKVMKSHIPQNNLVVEPLEQYQLPHQTSTAQQIAATALENVSNLGGEGLILRSPDGLWIPKRLHTLVKMKKLSDDEAKVIGCTSGRETDKGSKLLGLMGALIVEYNGKRFELSGFTDQERELRTIEGMPGAGYLDDHYDAQSWARHNPGEECPPWIEPKLFPRGTHVTFKYRELSNDGIPIEARYWRKGS